jgi:hypothetical protein
MFRVYTLYADDKQCAVAAVNEIESEVFLRHFQTLGDAQKCMKR